MPVRRSNGSSVGFQFLNPIHQPTLSKGSQDEITLVTALFWGLFLGPAQPSPRGAALSIAATEQHDAAQSGDAEDALPRV